MTLSKVLRNLGFKGSSCVDIINLIYKSGPQTQLELADSLGMTLGAVSRIAAKLEDAGMVERHEKLGVGGSRGFPPAVYTLNEQTRKLVERD